MGDDAEELAHVGFAVVAFDISPTAIAWCHERFPDSPVRYVAADLFTSPPAWHSTFDFGLEVYTFQVLPPELRPRAIERIAGYVAPGGRLLIMCRVRDGGRPWAHAVAAHLALARHIGDRHGARGRAWPACSGGAGVPSGTQCRWGRSGRWMACQSARCSVGGRPRTERSGTPGWPSSAAPGSRATRSTRRVPGRASARLLYAHHPNEDRRRDGHPVAERWNVAQPLAMPYNAWAKRDRDGMAVRIREAAGGIVDRASAAQPSARAIVRWQPGET